MGTLKPAEETKIVQFIKKNSGEDCELMRTRERYIQKKKLKGICNLT